MDDWKYTVNFEEDGTAGRIEGNVSYNFNNTFTETGVFYLTQPVRVKMIEYSYKGTWEVKDGKIYRSIDYDSLSYTYNDDYLSEENVADMLDFSDDEVLEILDQSDEEVTVSDGDLTFTYKAVP